MRHWSRKNKQRLTRQYKVEHMAAKLINEMLAKKVTARSISTTERL
ncbi:hypothetical protein ACQKP8_02195 [Photobacterium alginatilyticum]|nr:hypothetical protein [Photobacterium proteolyticum]